MALQISIENVIFINWKTAFYSHSAFHTIDTIIDLKDANAVHVEYDATSLALSQYKSR